MIFVDTPIKVLETEIESISTMPTMSDPQLDAWSAGVVSALLWIKNGGDSPSAKMLAALKIRTH